MTNEERRKAAEWFKNRAKNCPMPATRRMYEIATKAIEALPSAQPDVLVGDTISRQAAIDEIRKCRFTVDAIEKIRALPSAQSDIILCKDCKYWRRQTNYAGAPLSFGFCESDDMWRSLYGETYEVSHIDTDDDFYCGFAERREE